MIFKDYLLSYAALSGNGKYDLEQIVFAAGKKQHVRAPEPPPLKGQHGDADIHVWGGHPHRRWALTLARRSLTYYTSDAA